MTYPEAIIEQHERGEHPDVDRANCLRCVGARHDQHAEGGHAEVKDDICQLCAEEEN